MEKRTKVLQTSDLYIMMPPTIAALEKSLAMGRDRRHIFGQATSEDIDLEGELIDSAGLGPSLNFWKNYGQLDYCHKSSQHPKYLVGDPVDWRLEDGVTMIEGSLLDNWDMSDSIYQYLLSKGRMGYSLGGKVLKAEKGFEKDFGPMNKIQKVFINHIAVTPYPVNLNTKATLMPWDEFAKSLDFTKGCGDCAGDGKCGIDEECQCVKKSIETEQGIAEDKRMLISELGKSLATGAPGRGGEGGSGSPLRAESLEHGGDDELKIALRQFINQIKGVEKGDCVHMKKGFRDLNDAVDHFCFCAGLDMGKSFMMSGFLWENKERFKNIQLNTER